MADIDEIIDRMRYGETLKTLERTGWNLAGISATRKESIAEHSFGTILTSLLITQYLIKSEQKVNLEKILIMASIHDIQESITGDIPRTLENERDKEFMAKKARIEREAIHNIFDDSDEAFINITNLWIEYSEGKSLESRIVRGADILDMILHARTLESSKKEAVKLDEFFESSKEIIEILDVQIITQIFNRLLQEHQEYVKDSINEGE